MATPTIYSIKPDAQPGAIDISQVWAQANNELPTGFIQLVPLPWNGGCLLLAATAAGKVSICQLSDQPPFVTPLPKQLDLGSPLDILTSFVLGNVCYLLAYQQQKGILRFFTLGNDFALSAPYVYSRTRLPAITPGWTVLQPVTYLNKVYFVSYNAADGAVNLFAVVATAGAPANTAPLEADNVWAWTWARGWTRFAFFTLGGENFFLKTNIAKLNVNIDHLSLDPNIRSNEVLTDAQDALPGALTFSSVRPFYLADGAPYFLAYQADGQTEFYRLWPSCLGWTREAQLAAIPGATQIVTYRINDMTFALFY